MKPKWAETLLVLMMTGVAAVGAQVLERAIEEGGAEAATEVYRRYKTDPVRGQENTASEMIGYGYRFLSDRRLPEALTIFRLNAESYPESPAAQFHLGEAYRYTGQTDEAVRQYRRVLELAPEDAQAAARLQQLGAGD